MKKHLIALAMATAASMGAGSAQAADLRVLPVMIEPLPGARTSSITLINEEQRPLRVQIRVMRWTQVNGQDRLEPTKDVVVSPPMTTLAAGQHYLVRLVRTAKAAPRHEEAYRLFVDEVPEPGAAAPGTVNLIVRQSVPVFFSDVPQRASIVDWSVRRDGSRLWLVAHNRGDRRLRLSDLAIENHGGVVHQQAGLVGYVLPGATARWPIDADPALATDRTLHLRGVSDTGRLEVSLVDAPAS